MKNEKQIEVEIWLAIAENVHGNYSGKNYASVDFQPCKWEKLDLISSSFSEELCFSPEMYMKFFNQELKFRITGSLQNRQLVKTLCEVGVVAAIRMLGDDFGTTETGDYTVVFPSKEYLAVGYGNPLQVSSFVENSKESGFDFTLSAGQYSMAPVITNWVTPCI